MTPARSPSSNLQAYGILAEKVTDYAVWMLDVNGFLVSWSSGAQQLTGYTAEEMIGQHFAKFYSPEDIESGKPGRVLTEAARSGIVQEVNWCIRKDGSRLWTNVVITAVRDESGNLQGFGEFISDSTERLKLEDDLRRNARQLQDAMTERAGIERELHELSAQLESRVEERTRKLSRTINDLEAASRLKDKFLATLSHELFTPLTSITGWVHMLRTGKLSEAQAQRALEVIDRNLSTQKKLIEDLLNVSRIVSGKLAIDPSPINLVAVIRQTVDSVQPSADARQLHLELELDLHVGTVRLDPVRFQQIVWNLLTNAVKFTPPGGLIQVKLKRSDGQAILSVSDTGEGIPSEFLPYVFDRLRQVEPPRTRPQSGLGLGLSIVRNLVELHGGTVSVSSRGRGQGSTFSVHFPILSASKYPSTKEHPPGDSPFHNLRSSEIVPFRLPR
jgi:PAS domain S-box-containing protein